MTRLCIPFLVPPLIALSACAVDPTVESRPNAAPSGSYALAQRMPDAAALEPLAAAVEPPELESVEPPTLEGAPSPRLHSMVPGLEGAISTAPATPAMEAAPPLSRVSAANHAAEREPDSDNYVNAVQVYEWNDGALYRLYTAPERVSDIALEQGEGLISVAAGDTARWVIGDTASGAGPGRRTHVLVKPTAPGLRTNLVITTDRRVYRILLESSSGSAMASIAWAYPTQSLLALAKAPDEPVRQPTRPAEFDFEALDFDYAIMGDSPAWRPLRAFDDGNQVFIEFPEHLLESEAPPLFVSGERGRLELVNYRVRGRFYVVDRLFDVAELRLGERRQQVVRIVSGRAPAAAGRAR